MPLVGFESTISAFEQAETVHALKCAATVTDAISLKKTISSLCYENNAQ
jgi:hypothetical protein